MAVIYGGVSFKASESKPDLLPGTIGEVEHLCIRFDPNTAGVSVSMLGTASEIECLLQKIQDLLNQRAVEGFTPERIEAHATIRKSTLEIEGIDIGPIQDSVGPPRYSDAWFAERDQATVPAAHPSYVHSDQLNWKANASIIRPMLEPWVPTMNDAELYGRFMDWTTDGRHDLFAAHLNAHYEPKGAPSEA